MYCASTVVSWGQTIANSGFENWTQSPNGPFEECDNWGSFNYLSVLGFTAPVQKSTSAHSGDYSVRIESSYGDANEDGLEDTIPTVFFLGELDVFSGVNYVGNPCTQRPDSLVGYYKYSTVLGDNWLAKVALTYWDSALDTFVVVGSHDYIGGEAATFTRFSFPIDYVLPNTPDSVVVGFYSVNEAAGSSGGGSVLYLDDLQFVTASGVGIAENQNIEFSLSPVPANNEMWLASDFLGIYTIYDAQGKKLLAFEKTTFSEYAINTSEFTDGVYFLEHQGARKKFVVSH